MKNIILSLTLLFSSLAHGGAISSGGGMTVKFKGKMYLFDFLEAGIENDAYYSPDTSDVMKISKEIRFALYDFDKETVDGVISHVNFIFKLVPEFAKKYLAEAITQFQWKLVAPDVHDFEDLGTTYIRKENIPVYATAARDADSMVIYVQRDNFLALPIVHRIGLIFHEAIYSAYNSNYANLARVLSSSLFDKRLPVAEKDHLVQILHNSAIRNYYGQWLTYDQYIFAQSPEYQNACAKLRSSTFELMLSGLRVYSRLVESGLKFLDFMKKENEDWYATDTFLRYYNEVTIEGQKLYTPSLYYDKEMNIPKVYSFKHSWENIWGTRKEEDRYQPMDQSLRVEIQKVQHEMYRTLSWEESHLFGRCFFRKRGFSNDPLVIDEPFYQHWRTFQKVKLVAN